MRSNDRRDRFACRAPRLVGTLTVRLVRLALCLLTVVAGTSLALAETGSDQRLEEADIRAILDVAGLSDFRLLDEAQIESDWPDASFVWSNDAAVNAAAESVYGVLASYPIGVLDDFDKVVRQVVIDWSKSCSGRPRVRMHARRVVGDGKFSRRATVECADSGGTFFSRAFFVGGEKNVFGFAHFFTEPGRTRGEAADEAMYRTFIDIIGN